MRARILAACGLLLAAGLGMGAKTLTPLERALRALAGQSSEAGSATATARSAGLQADAAGSTTAAQASGGEWTSAVVDPLGLTATATSETITLSWSTTQTAVALAGYLVSRAEAGRALEPMTSQALTTASYQDLSATAGTWYTYQVTAVSGSGDTLVSSATILARLLPAVPPLAPEVSASNQEERVQLKWKKPTRTSYEVTAYLVRRKTGPGETAVLLTPAPVAKEEYYDETGDPRRNYLYEVLAVDARGQTGPASAEVSARARPRSRNGLILMSTAYRGVDWLDTGLTGDMMFTYYIGTLYGEQAKELSPLPLYLDPISLWLLSADAKYTPVSEKNWPLTAAVGGKASLQLFAGQQSQTSGSFTFSNKSELDYVWGGYAVISRSLGDLGLHSGYVFGSLGDPLLYLSKYLRYGDTVRTRNMFYFGMDLPLARRVNLAWEILYPTDAELRSQQHPVLVNMHVDRLFNFDVAYLHWDQGWAFLGYFNLRFTLFPSAN
ncbi:MAG: fibronectin type III domain-containing protein [candidate division FCPU426 bacterium]